MTETTKTKTDNLEIAYDIKTTDELLALMNIYYCEWEHRDSMMWKQTYTFFFAVLIVIIFPFIRIWDSTLQEIMPHIVFPIAGIELSFIFLYVTRQYAKRLNKSGDTYEKLIRLLPEEFERESIDKSNSIFEKCRLADTVPILMFSALIIFAIAILVLCICGAG